MDKRLERVEKEANNRRNSVVPVPDPEDEISESAADSPWSIATIKHLQDWASQDPKKLFDYIQEIRFDRDKFFEVAKDYKRLQTTHDELRATKYLEQKAKNGPDLETRQRLSSKLPDPPIFTDGVDPTWEDWLAKIDRKLAVNEDHYPTGISEIAYVLSRLGGKAAAFTANRSRRGAVRYYTSTDDLFNHLGSAYEG